MREDIRKLIDRYYPEPVYFNPLDRAECLHDTSSQHKLIYQIIGEIRSKVERDNLVHTSDQDYDLSEEIVIRDTIVLRISYLGPFAHLNTQNAKDKFSSRELDFIIFRIKDILAKYEILLLSDDEVNEAVPKLTPGDSVVGEKVTVWNCLFCEF